MNQYKYVVMCGGKYESWKIPRQLTRINGETLIARTVRFLHNNGISYKDIYVSTNNPQIKEYCDSVNIKVLWTENNNWVVPKPGVSTGDWCDCFCMTDYMDVCYIMGDVVFSQSAIKTIVETETNDIEFFASAPPFAKNYSKPYAEPFAFKVHNNEHLKQAIAETKRLYRADKFRRPPIAWEFWQVVKDTPINTIDYTNYTVINDYTCDIDTPEDIIKFEGAE